MLERQTDRKRIVRKKLKMKVKDIKHVLNIMKDRQTERQKDREKID